MKVERYVATLFFALATMWLPAAAQDSYDELVPQFDKEVHSQICGKDNEKLVWSGESYDRIQKIVARLNYAFPTYLIKDKSFNACASSSEIFIMSGLVDSDQSDNEVALVLAHEMTHITEGHLRVLFNKRMETSNAIESAINSINRAGNSDNTRLSIKVGNVIGEFLSMKYSRSQEEKADEGALLTVIDQGYDPEKAILLFDRLPAGFKGIFANLSNHPASAKRKAKSLAIIAQCQSGKIDLFKRALTNIRRSVDLPALAKPAKGDFTGYAICELDEGKLLYALAKGAGAITKDDKGNIELPPDASDIIVLGVNPDPKMFFDCDLTHFDFGYDHAVDRSTGDQTYKASYVSYSIPKSILLASKNFKFALIREKRGQISLSYGIKKPTVDPANLETSTITVAFVKKSDIPPRN